MFYRLSNGGFRVLMRKPPLLYLSQITKRNFSVCVFWRPGALQSSSSTQINFPNEIYELGGIIQFFIVTLKKG